LPKFAFLTQFNGHKFSGSQRQSNVRTVQEELEKAFSIFFKTKIVIVLSSRVDAGVHAREMVGHISAESLPAGDEHIICRHLNGILPPDISILRIVPVLDDFHARRSAIERSYIYKLRAHSQRFPLDGTWVAHTPYSLNLENLNQMSALLFGEHDFTGLSRPANYKTRPICKITECYWSQDPKDSLLTFRITADHFLYNMVRIIIGTQIGVENGKLSVDSLEKALMLKDRSFAGYTAPAGGLCLDAVKYPFILFPS
jgi:tRNA pseudouridine38-40 synthase